MTVCSVLLAGCVSSLTQRLGISRAEQPPKEKTGLVKPKMSGTQDTESPSDKKDAGQASTSQQKSSAKAEDVETANPTRVQDKSASEQEGQGKAKASDARDKTRRASAADEKGQDEASLPSTQEIRNSFRSLSLDPKDKQTGSGTRKSKSGADAGDSDDDREGDAPPLQKHDHAKYLQFVRGKAIDMVNKEKNITLARLCRDSTTEEWTLTMYQRHPPNYSFVTYMWDEVDGKWERAFSSGTRPVSGWKQHLDFASSGKDCKVLKGTGAE